MSRSYSPVGLSLEEIADQYEEALALIRELAEDLKRSYHPDKGWPPHIESAMDLGDHEQCLCDLRALALAELPPDLLRVLRDPSIIVPQDQAVFEMLARWRDAPSNTASAD